MWIAGVVVVALMVAGIVAYIMLRDPDSDSGGGGKVPPEAHELLSLSWEEFEALLREAFERDGFRVFERQQGGATGPAAGMADIVLDKKGKRWFVSAKYWRENTVPGHAVQELYSAMVAAGAAGGFIITRGNFGAAAKVLAKEREIELIDGGRLLAMLDPVRKNPNEGTRRRLERAKQAETTGRRQVPCPLCGRPMQRRMDRHGPNAGHSYYACSDYPRCKGMRQIG